jgi:hypothetical protein
MRKCRPSFPRQRQRQRPAVVSCLVPAQWKWEKSRQPPPAAIALSAAGAKAPVALPRQRRTTDFVDRENDFLALPTTVSVVVAPLENEDFPLLSE